MSRLFHLGAPSVFEQQQKESVKGGSYLPVVCLAGRMQTWMLMLYILKLLLLRTDQDGGCCFWALYMIPYLTVVFSVKNADLNINILMMLCTLCTKDGRGHLHILCTIYQNKQKIEE